MSMSMLSSRYSIFTAGFFLQCSKRCRQIIKHYLDCLCVSIYLHSDLISLSNSHMAGGGKEDYLLIAPTQFDDGSRAVGSKVTAAELIGADMMLMYRI